MGERECNRVGGSIDLSFWTGCGPSSRRSFKWRSGRHVWSSNISSVLNGTMHP